MNVNKKLALNTILSVCLQIVIVINSFVVPRLILQFFGSEINGLQSSIGQFLSFISFMEMGVGSVVCYNLYKPLAENDNSKLSEIVVASEHFFKNIAYILLIYIICLCVIFPLITQDEFSDIYTIMLILAMSISYFAQYYFGMTNQLLLTADLKGYIQYAMQIMVVVLNMVATIILLYCGCGIHFVKLTTSLIFIIRPVVLWIYVKKHYDINHKVKYKKDVIKQKWNGIAQHIAAIVLDSTDVMVLTFFSNLSNVSIYHIYYIVVYGVRCFIVSISSGMQSLIGNLIAKSDFENFDKYFSYFEWINHLVTVFLYTCTGLLIVPFVLIYTDGINDANYCVPLFACLITLAFAVKCIMNPYLMIVLSAGHYKQTQNCFIIAALLNICVSIALVIRFGLIGVAIGTIVAMLYQTVYLVSYNSKNIAYRSFRIFMKHIIVDIITVIIIIISCMFIHRQMNTVTQWLFSAIMIVSIAIVVTMVLNYVFYKEELLFALRKIKNVIKK